MKKIFDYAFIGAGVATVFALQRMTDKQTQKRSIIFDIGRPPLKRKHQVLGWLGCMLSSDGKLFTDSAAMESLLTKDVYSRYSANIISYLNDKNLISPLVDNRVPIDFVLNNSDYEIVHHPYHQMIPKNMHEMSKSLSRSIIDNKKFEFHFDDEVFDITKVDDMFEISTANTTYYAKNLVLATGRAGTLFTHGILSKHGLLKSDNKFQFGVKIEVDTDIVRDLNKSTFSMTKGDITYSKFLWNGTMVPEDRFDYTIASYRSNETRWTSDKVHFDLFKTVHCEGATKELNRIATLAFIAVCNERVVRENLKSIIQGRSKFSILPEFGISKKKGGWLIDALKDLDAVLPGIVTSGKAYINALNPIGSYELNLDKNMCAGDDIYTIGEASGIAGMFQSAVSGNYFADQNF